MFSLAIGTAKESCVATVPSPGVLSASSKTAVVFFRLFFVHGTHVALLERVVMCVTKQKSLARLSVLFAKAVADEVAQGLRDRVDASLHP